MRINYGKTKSDAVAKADGTYVERPKKIVKREDLRKGTSCAPDLFAAGRCAGCDASSCVFVLFGHSIRFLEFFLRVSDFQGCPTCSQKKIIICQCVGHTV